MSRRKVPFQFSPAFAELPPEWLELTYRQRSVIQDLWRIGTLSPCGSFTSLKTSGRPAQHLTMRLDIKDRRDARNVTESIHELMEKGLVQADGPVVSIYTSCHSAGIHRAASEQPVSNRATTSEQPQTPKVAESLNTHTADQIKLEEIRSESESARAREAPEVQRQKPEPAERFVPARRPVPEPPPDFTPAPQIRPLKSVIWDEYCRIVLNRDVSKAGERDWKALETIQAAVVAEVGDSRPAQLRETQRLLEAWKRDPKSTQQISNLAAYLFKYTKPLPPPSPMPKPAPVRREPEPENPALAFADMASFGLEVLADLRQRQSAKAGAR